MTKETNGSSTMHAQSNRIELNRIESKVTHPCPASKSARVAIDLEAFCVVALAAFETAFLVAAAIDDFIVTVVAL